MSEYIDTSMAQEDQTYQPAMVPDQALQRDPTIRLYLDDKLNDIFDDDDFEVIEIWVDETIISKTRALSRIFDTMNEMNKQAKFAKKFASESILDEGVQEKIAKIRERVV